LEHISLCGLLHRKILPDRKKLKTGIEKDIFSWTPVNYSASHINVPKKNTRRQAGSVQGVGTAYITRKSEQTQSVISAWPAAGTIAGDFFLFG
jgi:hypothetical protein